MKHPLNSNDTLYVDVRDKNFSVVSRILSSKAKTLKTSEDSRHDARTFTEIKDFVKKLGAPRPAPPRPAPIRRGPRRTQASTEHSLQPEPAGGAKGLWWGTGWRAAVL